MTAFPYAKFRPETSAEATALVRQVAAEVGQAEAGSTTLPPAAYLSASFFMRERERLFEPGWIAVAHLCQLDRPQDCEVDLFGARVTIAADGAEVVVTAVAPDGESRRLRHDVLGGFVYVNLSADADALRPQLPELSQRFARLNLADLEPVFRMDYDTAFNWKILIETFMECYHHAGAHPKTFESVFPARLAGVGEEGALWTSGYALARDDALEAEILTGLPLLADDFSDIERRSFYLYNIFPNQIFVILADRVVWFRNQPVSSGETKVQVFMFARSGARDRPGYAEAVAREHAFFSQVNDEDIAANDSQQLGLGSRLAEPGRFSHLEGSLYHLARYVRRRMAVA